MARYTGPATRKSRRLRVDLVGGDRNPSSVARIRPGQAGRARIKESEYLAPAAGEAEGPLHLRRHGEAVPPLLRRGEPSPRQDRRRTWSSCWKPASTTSSTVPASPARVVRHVSSFPTVTSP